MSEARPALRKLAKNRRFDEMEEALLEDIETGAVDAEELASVLTLVVHRADPAPAESLLWLALSTWGEKHGPAEGLGLARDIVPLLPGSGMLREEVSGLYEAAHGSFEGLGTLLDRTVRSEAVELPAAMARADALLAMPPGTFYKDRLGKVAGRVVGLSADGASLATEHEGRERLVTLEQASALVPLPADDFMALFAFHRDRLAAMAEEDPAGLVESLLRSHGPSLSYREVRALLGEVVPGTFATWWNEEAPRVRRSPWLELSGGAQPTFTLRKTAVSPALRVREDFDNAAGAVERCGTVLAYLAGAGEKASEDRDLVSYLGGALLAQCDAADHATALASRAVLDRLRAVRPDLPGAEGELPGPAETAQAFAGLPDPALQRAVLDLVLAGEDGLARAGAALPACAPEVAEELAALLREEGREDLVTAAAETAMNSPGRFPAALVWLFKEYGAGRISPERGGPRPTALLGQLVIAADRSMRATGEGRKLFNRIKSVLSARGAETARRILTSTDDEGAREVRECVDRCFSFSEDFRAQVSDLLVETHPKLFVQVVAPWEQADVIYTTREGLDRQKAQLDRLVLDVLPGIAEAIGRAAAEGDLSENAEYTALLEKRQRTTERANSLQDDLKKARVMPPEMAGDREVSVGSRVRVRDENAGEEAEFTFLGPWDVDVERGVVSYRAPLGLAFMGHRAGDTVEFGAGAGQKRYRILSIGSGIPS